MAKIEVQLPDGGKLIAQPSEDSNYPGIWVEYVNESKLESQVCSPAVLMEYTEGELRALLWADKENEDYTHKIGFDI